MKHIKRLLEHKKALLFLSIFWTLLMLFLCLDTTDDFPIIKVKNIDKLAHFCFHFGFVWLWFFYFICDKKLHNLIKTAILTISLSVIYGIIIEFLQNQFTTTRKADILDVLANFVGAIAAVLIAVYFRKCLQNQKSEIKKH